MKRQKPIVSIRQRLHTSYMTIISLLAVPTLLLLFFLLQTSAQYNRHISYIANARDITELSGTQLEGEIWNIVAGNQAYAAGSQETIMKEIYTRLEQLLHETETYESRQQIMAAIRLADTMDTYIKQLDAPPYRHATMYSDEQIFREIRSVSGLLQAVLQEYIYIEIGVISAINAQLRTAVFSMALLSLLLLLTTVAASLDSCRTVQEDIQRPIDQLEAMSVELAAGHLDARTVPPDVAELKTLTDSLNTMADQLGNLIDRQIADQRSLRKAEMRTLQAQITPHFIYNTLDTIVWLAQQKEHELVVDLTMALTQFFRISLSGGQDFISLGREIAHVESYLKIQSVRYERIMSYRIEIEEALYQYQILKLLLQPLVENAIYHGIKKQRGRGMIVVKGIRNADNTMTFTVSDTGIGMKPEQLEQVRNSLMAERPPSNGFGLYNVNQRIRLYYDAPGLQISSTYREGTTISFTLPCRLKE